MHPGHTVKKSPWGKKINFGYISETYQKRKGLLNNHINSSKRRAKIIAKYIISITGEAGYKTLLLTVYKTSLFSGGSEVAYYILLGLITSPPCNFSIRKIKISTDLPKSWSKKSSSFIFVLKWYRSYKLKVSTSATSS